MNNKTKLVTICALVLSIALLAFGIYALKTASLTVGGTIGFKTHDCTVLVYGTITGAITDPEDMSEEPITLYLVNYAGTGEFVNNAPFTVSGEKELAFETDLWQESDSAYVNAPVIYFDDSVDGDPSIVLTLYLKNNSPYPVSVEVQDVTPPDDSITYTVSELTRLEKNVDEYSELTITLTLPDDIEEIPVTETNFGVSVYFARTKEKLAAPGNVVVDTTAKTVTFDAVEGATSYEIAYYKEGEESGEPLSTQSVTPEALAQGPVALEYEPQDSGNYIIKVRAVREEDGEKDYSDYQNGDNSIRVLVPSPASWFTFGEGYSGYYAVTGYIGDPDVHEIVIPRTFSIVNGEYVDGPDYEVHAITSESSFRSGFKNFSGSVILLDNIYRIQSYSFSECENITSITIQEPLMIDGSAFSRCTNLTNVYFGGTLEQWCDMRTSDGGGNPCCNGATLYVNGNEKVTKVDFREFTNYSRVERAIFDGCKDIKEIIIPESVTEISYDAFKGTGITSITIPKTITTIEKNTFYDCKDLSNVEFKGNVTTIKSGAFGRCTSLKTIQLPENLTTLEGQIFEFSGITTISIPKNITTINHSMFYHCESLKNVTFEGEVTEFNNNLFESCVSLEHITLPHTLKTIGSNVFSFTGLKDIVIPKSVTSIGGTSFYHCDELTSVIFMDGDAIELGSRMFSSCGKLKEVILPNNLTKISDNFFESCTSLEKVVIPKTVESIDRRAFFVCYKLSKVYYTGNDAEYATLLENVINEDNNHFQNAQVYYQISGPDAQKPASGKWWYYTDDTQTTINDSDTTQP